MFDPMEGEVLLCHSLRQMESNLTQRQPEVSEAGLRELEGPPELLQHLPAVGRHRAVRSNLFGSFRMHNIYI